MHEFNQVHGVSLSRPCIPVWRFPSVSFCQRDLLAGQEVLTLTFDFASDSWISKIIGPALRRFIFPDPPAHLRLFGI